MDNYSTLHANNLFTLPPEDDTVLWKRLVYVFMM